MVGLDAPRAVVATDTLEARVTVRAGQLAVHGATLSLVAGTDAIATMPLDSLGAGVERTLTMRGRIEGAVRTVSLAAVVTVAGDVEHRNDTLAMAVQVSPAAGAVLGGRPGEQLSRCLPRSASVVLRSHGYTSPTMCIVRCQQPGSDGSHCGALFPCTSV